VVRTTSHLPATGIDRDQRLGSVRDPQDLGLRVIMKIRHLIFVCLSWAAMPASAVDAASPRLEKLYASFIAPCCWSRNLTEHDSQVAVEMRGQIDRMVQAGRSDDQIKAVFVAKYGERILALPEGAPRVWLFWMPVAVALVGLMAVSFFLKCSRLKASHLASDVAPAELDADWDAS
jgi:cytochrome c-type biogenesis protein CcmH